MFKFYTHQSRKIFTHSLNFLTLVALGSVIILPSAYAQPFLGYSGAPSEENDKDLETPPSLRDLENIPKENEVIEGELGIPFDIRKEAQSEAAISYGARGGLAWRTFHIRQELQMRASYLDKIYNFAELLIPAPSGLLIEPPIISSVENAMIIDAGGQQAAVADRVINIMENAQIVSTPRSWRSYLEREWGDVEMPPDILRPENKEERERWVKLVNKGWEQGVTQANEIFEEDLNRLNADFQGMVRFRLLLAQGMVSAPYSLQEDRGVTGGGDEMKIGDRAVSITNAPALVPGFEEWQPVNR